MTSYTCSKVICIHPVCSYIDLLVVTADATVTLVMLHVHLRYRGTVLLLLSSILHMLYPDD
jgi:hypothetical protein